MTRILLEFPRTPATMTGTPPWIKAVPARDKLVRLRALATEALSIWNDLKSWSAYLRHQLDLLIGDKDTDTCTILQNIDKFYSAYVRASRRLNEIRQEIDRLLADPEVQAAIPESLVRESYRAKKNDYHFLHVVFSEVPPKEPTVRTEFVNNLADLQSKYEQAKHDYDLHAQLAAKEWESSAERLQAEARIAQAVERLIPAIRDYKAGKITEVELNAKVNKEVLDAAADIAKIVQEWATKKSENAKKALDAQSKMNATATKIRQLTRECPELKAKYNVIDKPEGWDEWLRSVGLA